MDTDEGAYYEPFAPRLTTPPWRWTSSTDKSRWSELFVDYANRPGRHAESDSDRDNSPIPGFTNNNINCDVTRTRTPTPGPADASNTPTSPPSGSPEASSPKQPIPVICNGTNWGRDNFKHTATLNVMTPPESPALTTEEKEPKPVLTWDPTIWAPLDPDNFHPPGMKGVRQVREHGKLTAMPASRGQLLLRSAFPWWLDSYVRRDYSGAECAHCQRQLDRRYAIAWRSMLFLFNGWHPCIRASTLWYIWIWGQQAEPNVADELVISLA
ncbi:hypothetical protein F4820DRAFT_465111 [Hypoxylon rubiginosum]|uniref:Uncharacterized protein n=1 Tax=Hypoxylon rubiginosum TaxID=110542 RepID=A0ACB9YNX5_9PEZI|nr:hypothetical protein F4820DRAFT_465111 [Hypoxylon rubiginosum]